MIHKEITDKQWKSIVKHLPKPAKTGRPRCNDRITINGILFVLTVGCRWERTTRKVWFKINCTSQITRLATKRSLEKDSLLHDKISTQTKQD